AFLVLPILPEPLRCDGFVALLRYTLLPYAFVWAFAPMATNAQAWLRRLSYHPRRATQRWAQPTPPSLVTTTVVPEMAPRPWPVQLIQSWFSSRPSPTVRAVTQETPALIKPRPLHQEAAALSSMPPRTRPELPPVPETSDVCIPKRSRLRVRR